MLYTLALESSWATRFITSFLRSAITFQVSVNVHVLAIILREHLDLHLPDDFLPLLLKPPLLHRIRVIP